MGYHKPLCSIESLNMHFLYQKGIKFITILYLKNKMPYTMCADVLYSCRTGNKFHFMKHDDSLGMPIQKIFKIKNYGKTWIVKT